MYASRPGFGAVAQAVQRELFQKMSASSAKFSAAIDATAILPLRLQCYEMAFFKTSSSTPTTTSGSRAAMSACRQPRFVRSSKRVTTAIVKLLHRGQRVAKHAHARIYPASAHAGGASPHIGDAATADPLVRKVLVRGRPRH